MSDVEWDGIPNCRSSISKGFTTDSHAGERDVGNYAMQIGEFSKEC